MPSVNYAEIFRTGADYVRELTTCIGPYIGGVLKNCSDIAREVENHGFIKGSASTTFLAGTAALTVDYIRRFLGGAEEGTSTPEMEAIKYSFGNARDRFYSLTNLLFRGDV